MPKGGKFMEELNDEWGSGCLIDGKECIDCGDCDTADDVFGGDEDDQQDNRTDEDSS